MIYAIDFAWVDGSPFRPFYETMRSEILPGYRGNRRDAPIVLEIRPGIRWEFGDVVRNARLFISGAQSAIGVVWPRGADLAPWLKIHTF